MEYTIEHNGEATVALAQSDLTNLVMKHFAEKGFKVKAENIVFQFDVDVDRIHCHESVKIRAVYVRGLKGKFVPDEVEPVIGRIAGPVPRIP